MKDIADYIDYIIAMESFVGPITSYYVRTLPKK